jgi:hypothetical protein
VSVTAPTDCVRFDGDPVPAVNPKMMNSTNAAIFSAVSPLLAARPGPTPRMWISANNMTTALAASV